MAAVRDGGSPSRPRACSMLQLSCCFRTRAALTTLHHVPSLRCNGKEVHCPTACLLPCLFRPAASMPRTMPLQACSMPGLRAAASCLWGLKSSHSMHATVHDAACMHHALLQPEACLCGLLKARPGSPHSGIQCSMLTHRWVWAAFVMLCSNREHACVGREWHPQAPHALGSRSVPHSLKAQQRGSRDAVLCGSREATAGLPACIIRISEASGYDKTSLEIGAEIREWEMGEG